MNTSGKTPVSYTHLDVYKRQPLLIKLLNLISTNIRPLNLIPLHFYFSVKSTDIFIVFGI